MHFSIEMWSDILTVIPLISHCSTESTKYWHDMSTVVIQNVFLLLTKLNLISEVSNIYFCAINNVISNENTIFCLTILRFPNRFYFHTRRQNIIPTAEAIKYFWQFKKEVNYSCWFNPDQSYLIHIRNFFLTCSTLLRYRNISHISLDNIYQSRPFWNEQKNDIRLCSRFSLIVR